MKAKFLFKFLLTLYVLNVINADKNDVHFDFNSNNNYYKVNIATNKPTVLPVTLYNPHVWPGPNDTFTTTTTTPKPSAQRRRFVFGKRRSVENINKGYGYDTNILQNTTNPSVETTISPFNRKFYTFDPTLFMNASEFYWQNTTRQFQTSPEVSRRILIPRNYSSDIPRRREHNYTYYLPPVRKIIRRIPVRRNRTRVVPIRTAPTRTAPTNWQIFAERPLQNFSRDLGDFQDIVVKDLTNSANFSKIDIPIITTTVITSFSCQRMPYYGYFADIESDCKLFHICTPDGRRAAFLCPEHLRFNQLLTVCDWSERVFCDQSVNFYNTNLIKFANWNQQPLIGRK